MAQVEILPLAGIPELREGDDLAALSVTRSSARVASRTVTWSSSRRRRCRRPRAAGAQVPVDRHVDAILGEAARVRRRRGDFVIAETRHGFVCASAGIDRSNTAGDDWVVLLPLDPDASARGLREALGRRFGVAPAVVVTDSFGRAWRQGTTDVAIGVAGMLPLLDLRGQPDARGRELQGTVICVADELAGAAELVMGKARQVPAALIRGYAVPVGEGSATELVMPRERDLFP